MKSQLFTLILVVCLFITVSKTQEVESPELVEGEDASNGPLQCYVCTGDAKSDCGVNVKESKHLTDCPEAWDEEDKKNKPTLCRVIHQVIRDEVSFIRKCGYELYKGKKEQSCYKTVHQEYTTHNCQCFEDGCNAGNGISGSFVLGLVAMVALLLVK